MCDGHVIAPPGKPNVETLSLRAVFKRFWGRFTCSAVLTEQYYKVNMCLKCGDLEIGGDWQKIPHPQKPRISDAIISGAITINGELMVCGFCASMEEEIKEKRENIYKDSRSNLEFEILPVSPMSF